MKTAPHRPVPPQFVVYECWKAKLEYFLSEASDAAADGCSCDEIARPLLEVVFCLRNPHCCLGGAQSALLRELASNLEEAIRAARQGGDIDRLNDLEAWCSRTRSTIVNA